RGELPALHRHWKAIALVGVTNSAIPFVVFGYAALSITAGLASVFNAATPLFSALIGWLWLREPLTRWRSLGLAIGFVGVLGLAWNKIGLKPGAGDLQTALAIGACLLATLMYGLSTNLTKRTLTGAPAMAIAAGSQLGAAVALAIPAALTWPATLPGPLAWGAVLALAVLCSALGYVLYFRLIAHTGPTHAASVTFLIPLFAMAWGSWFLGETVTPAMVIGCAVIVAGTALVIGLWPRPLRVRV
ncbi:MAG: DMT family transporter, partial [Burkholderiales bacterium]|nr:DMT family transporter [Burkholderiales bacterium]